MSVTYFGTGRTPRRRLARAVSVDAEFIPQAILRASISHISEVLGIAAISLSDDLDEFDGVTIQPENLDFPVAIRHYAGHPPETVTVYFPYEVNEVDRISAAVALIVEDLHLNTQDIFWQRKDNPEL